MCDECLLECIPGVEVQPLLTYVQGHYKYLK